MKIFLCAIIGASFILGACSSSDSNDAPPATTEVEIPIETPEEEVTETPVVVEPTPTAEIVIPTPAPLIHTVQPGNSLSQIAQSYGVPIELLAAENGIEDYNLIQVGQEIVIPLIEDEEE
ncbi:MAG: LysM peptidoglycan-binding domain-containing protein [Actinomycetota bacterium]|jgi:LysM repeat protein|nr:LysM peptidoglycan-binding domain-containing protein [Actinomycetota bacterium]|tara:strand:+ start:274 stop:633 length:360 start_codon:yes stop_codon:yes gene_type:complete